MADVPVPANPVLRKYEYNMAIASLGAEEVKKRAINTDGTPNPDGIKQMQQWGRGLLFQEEIPTPEKPVAGADSETKQRAALKEAGVNAAVTQLGAGTLGELKAAKDAWVKLGKHDLSTTLSAIHADAISHLPPALQKELSSSALKEAAGKYIVLRGENGTLPGGVRGNDSKLDFVRKTLGKDIATSIDLVMDNPANAPQVAPPAQTAPAAPQLAPAKPTQNVPAPRTQQDTRLITGGDVAENITPGSLGGSGVKRQIT